MAGVSVPGLDASGAIGDLDRSILDLVLIELDAHPADGPAEEHTDHPAMSAN